MTHCWPFTWNCFVILTTVHLQFSAHMPDGERRCPSAQVVSYGISINLVEVTWKSKIKQQFPNPNDYSAFMGDFSSCTGAPRSVSQMPDFGVKDGYLLGSFGNGSFELVAVLLYCDWAACRSADHPGTRQGLRSRSQTACGSLRLFFHLTGPARIIVLFDESTSSRLWPAGAVTFLMMLLSRFIFRKYGWGVAAQITPTVLLITGIAFFGLIVFSGACLIPMNGLHSSFAADDILAIVCLVAHPGHSII